MLRTLKFIIDKQVLKQDPKCDFNDLVPGSEGFIQAEFSFSSDWDSYTKVVAFFSNLGEEYRPQILDKSLICSIPIEALKRRIFKLQIIGKKDDTIIRTNKVAVEQIGGKV